MTTVYTECKSLSDCTHFGTNYICAEVKYSVTRNPAFYTGNDIKFDNKGCVDKSMCGTDSY